MLSLNKFEISKRFDAASKAFGAELKTVLQGVQEAKEDQLGSFNAKLFEAFNRSLSENENFIEFSERFRSKAREGLASTGLSLNLLTKHFPYFMAAKPPIKVQGGNDLELNYQLMNYFQSGHYHQIDKFFKSDQITSIIIEYLQLGFPKAIQVSSAGNRTMFLGETPLNPIHFEGLQVRARTSAFSAFGLDEKSYGCNPLPSSALLSLGFNPRTGRQSFHWEADSISFSSDSKKTAVVFTPDLTSRDATAVFHQAERTMQFPLEVLYRKETGETMVDMKRYKTQYPFSIETASSSLAHEAKPRKRLVLSLEQTSEMLRKNLVSDLKRYTQFRCRTLLTQKKFFDEPFAPDEPNFELFNWVAERFIFPHLKHLLNFTENKSEFKSHEIEIKDQKDEKLQPDEKLFKVISDEKTWDHIAKQMMALFSHTNNAENTEHCTLVETEALTQQLARRTQHNEALQIVPTGSIPGCGRSYTVRGMKKVSKDLPIKHALQFVIDVSGSMGKSKYDQKVKQSVASRLSRAQTALESFCDELKRSPTEVSKKTFMGLASFGQKSTKLLGLNFQPEQQGIKGAELLKTRLSRMPSGEENTFLDQIKAPLCDAYLSTNERSLIHKKIMILTDGESHDSVGEFTQSVRQLQLRHVLMFLMSLAGPQHQNKIFLNKVSNWVERGKIKASPTLVHLLKKELDSYLGPKSPYACLRTLVEQILKGEPLLDQMIIVGIGEARYNDIKAIADLGVPGKSQVLQLRANEEKDLDRRLLQANIHAECEIPYRMTITAEFSNGAPYSVILPLQTYGQNTLETFTIPESLLKAQGEPVKFSYTIEHAQPDPAPLTQSSCYLGEPQAILQNFQVSFVKRVLEQHFKVDLKNREHSPFLSPDEFLEINENYRKYAQELGPRFIARVKVDDKLSLFKPLYGFYLELMSRKFYYGAQFLHQFLQGELFKQNNQAITNDMKRSEASTENKSETKSAGPQPTAQDDRYRMRGQEKVADKFTYSTNLFAGLPFSALEGSVELEKDEDTDLTAFSEFGITKTNLMNQHLSVSNSAPKTVSSTASTTSTDQETKSPKVNKPATTDQLLQVKDEKVSHVGAYLMLNMISPNQLNENKNLPIVQAALDKNFDHLEMLLRAGAFIGSPRIEVDNFLNQVITRCSLDTFKSVMEVLEKIIQESLTKSTTRISIKEVKEEVFGLRGKEDSTLLHALAGADAAALSESKDTQHTLLEKIRFVIELCGNGILESRDAKGYTPLHYAVKDTNNPHQAAVIGCLIAQKADLNARASKQCHYRTPALEALHQDNSEAVGALLSAMDQNEQKTFFNYKSLGGDTILDLALADGDPQVIKHLRVANFLIDKYPQVVKGYLSSSQAPFSGFRYGPKKNMEERLNFVLRIIELDPAVFCRGNASKLLGILPDFSADAVRSIFQRLKLKGITVQQLKASTFKEQQMLHRDFRATTVEQTVAILESYPDISDGLPKSTLQKAKEVLKTRPVSHLKSPQTETKSTSPSSVSVLVGEGHKDTKETKETKGGQVPQSLGNNPTRLEYRDRADLIKHRKPDNSLGVTPSTDPILGTVMKLVSKLMESKFNPENCSGLVSFLSSVDESEFNNMKGILQELEAAQMCMTFLAFVRNETPSPALNYLDSMLGASVQVSSSSYGAVTKATVSQETKASKNAAPVKTALMCWIDDLNVRFVHRLAGVVNPVEDFKKTLEELRGAKKAELASSTTANSSTSTRSTATSSSASVGSTGVTSSSTLSNVLSSSSSATRTVASSSSLSPASTGTTSSSVAPKRAGR